MADPLLDDLPPSEPTTVSTKKVELDLDDAPFLQADEPAPPPVPMEDNLPASEANGGAPGQKKKKMIIIGAICGFVVIVAVCAWWFFFRTPPPPPPPGPEPEVIVVPSTATPAGAEDIVTQFAPFIVPINDNMKDTTFLICKFAAISQNPAVTQELKQQILPLRDAVYFYLKGKDPQFILDARNGESIKKDLLSVFNDYLTQGKLEDVVFESYLNR